MTAPTANLDTLRQAHGQFVATVLSVARKSDPRDTVQHLVAHNRWIAAQLRSIYHQSGEAQSAAATAISDVAGLLAELAASCADVGAVVRNLPDRAQSCGDALLAAVIGQYGEQTARLRGGASV